MYNNVDANSLQYNFERDPMKTTTEYYPSVGLSGQKIHAAQSQQKYCLLVGTDIAFVVTN